MGSPHLDNQTLITPHSHAFIRVHLARPTPPPKLASTDGCSRKSEHLRRPYRTRDLKLLQNALNFKTIQQLVSHRHRPSPCSFEDIRVIAAGTSVGPSMLLSQFHDLLALHEASHLMSGLVVWFVA